MKKPIIIHIIYDLGLGGAEKMLMNSVEHLTSYEHVIVTLLSRNQFSNFPFGKSYNLNCGSFYRLPLAILKLKKIIREIQPALIHSHLPLPNIISRLSTPSGIPLFTSIHTTASKSSTYTKWHIKQLERLSFRLRPSVMISVSDNVLKDYIQFFNLQPRKNYVLNTYADEKIFKPKEYRNSISKLKMITVGNKESKNVDFLLKAISKLNDPRIELDIYGGGQIPSVYEDIKKQSLPVRFKGQIEQIEKVLPHYDYYISASRLEGFSLSILEAMACKLTLILSDIPSFKEQAEDTAFYFSLNDPQSLENTLLVCLNNPNEPTVKANESNKRYLEKFTLSIYVKKLSAIYNREP